MEQESGSRGPAPAKAGGPPATTGRKRVPAGPRRSEATRRAAATLSAAPRGDGRARATPTRTIILSANGEKEPPAPSTLPRKLRYRLARIGPWSVFKLSMFFSLGAMILVIGALAILYLMLDASGVLASIEKVVNQYGIVHHFRFDAGWILTRVVWIGLFMVVLGSLVATCLAWFYNAVSDATGGLDVSLEPFDEEPRPVARAEARPRPRLRRMPRHAPRRAPAKVVRMSARILGLPTGDGNGTPLDKASGL